MSDKEELKPEVRAQISSVMRSTDLAPKEKQRRVQLLMSSGDVIDFEKLAAEEEEQKAQHQHQSGEEHADAKDDGDEKNKTQEKEEEKEKEEEEETMPQSEIDAAIGEGVWRDEEHTVRGCAHYMRGCYIRAACCGHVYPCRLCHDAAEDHEIDRFATHEIVCATCHRLQPLSNHCTNPACRDAPAFGTVHYCEPCRIWSSDPAKPMFHCDKCRLCRVGTRDTVTHCDACGCCYNNAAFADHQCRANRLDGLCPVCMGRLFDSTDPATFLECGHTIHAKCFRALLRSGDPRCPLCKKCVVDMKLANLETALEIARTPLPEPYASWVSVIDCNECGTKSVVPFHILGHCCSACHSFNTAVLSKRPRTPDDPPAPAVDVEDLARQVAELLAQQRQERHQEQEQSQEHPVDENGSSSRDDDDDEGELGLEEPHEGGDGEPLRLIWEQVFHNLTGRDPTDDDIMLDSEEDGDSDDDDDGDENDDDDETHESQNGENEHNNSGDEPTH